MPVAAPPTASTVPRPRWRWLRRSMAGLAVGLCFLVVFHRPLGHWAIRYFGGGALAKVGISGEWTTSGPWPGGLRVDGLKLTGNEAAQVRSVTMRHAELEYDLMALRGEGIGTMLKRLVVQDLKVEIDLTRPGPPRPPRAASGAKTTRQLPQVVLPELRIEHLSLQLRLPQDVLVVRDFSLVLDPAKPGFLEAKLLDLPGTPLMENVKGVTKWEARKFILENTLLGPDLGIERLVLDLADLVKQEAAVELVAYQGPARMALTGRSGAWFSSVTADLKLEVSDLSEQTLAFWGVPAGGATWQAGQLQLSVRGPVLRPDLLEVSLSLGKGRLGLREREVSPITLHAAMRDGQFTLTNLAAEVGGNGLKAHGKATLPAGWVDFAKAPGDLDFSFQVPEPAALLPPSPVVEGRVDGQGQLAFANLKVTRATAGVKAMALQVQGVPVESAEVAASLSGGTLVLEAVKVRLNEQNTLNASGNLELGGPRQLAVRWQAEAHDLATVPVEARAGLGAWPGAGRVLSQGKAGGSLRGWQAGNWASLEGEATLEVRGLRIKEASLESLRLQAGAKAGAVKLEELSVRLDGDNHLKASGAMDLTEIALPLSGSVALRLPDVALASRWSTQFGGPVLRAGKAQVDWKGEGRLQPLQMDSTGGITVQALKLDGVPEVLGLSADLLQSGGEIRIPKLSANAGPWRAAGSAFWDGGHLTIPKLEAFAKDQRLLELSVRVPWQEGGFPPDAPLSLQLKVDGLDASRLATALGRRFPVQGLLKADGKFEGTLQTLQGGLTAEASQLKPAGAPAGPKLEPATVTLAVRIKEGQLTMDGTAVQRPLEPLTFQAGLPVDFAGLVRDPRRATTLPLKAQLKLPASSLAFLPSWIPALRSVDGTMAADFTVSGTVGRPVWQGSATVSAPQASFVSGSLPTVKDLKLRARITEQKLSLEEASVMLAGGRLRLEGGAGIGAPALPVLDLKLTADEVLVLRDENLSLRANASILCRGPISKADVRGQIDLVRGRVFKEIEFLPLSLPNDLPPPPPSTTLARQGPPALPPPFDQWNFDIAIKTRDPIRLMGNVAKGNAVAELKLAGPGAKPELTGKVRLEEMWLRLPFSRLNITEGALTFTREQPFDPQIDLTGESITGSRMVQVFVQGRALDPKVRLTSSPPLPEGEIAALLATGVTTSDLTSSSDEAAGRAAYVLLKQTYRKLFRQAATGSDDEEPPRLSFDFSVFGSDPSRRGVSAIYELNPHWRAIGRVGETGTFRGLLHYLIRFR